MADENKVTEPRTAYFGCKDCGAINQQPFPEIRVVTKVEPCKCGIDSDSLAQRYWALALATAGSILILSVFGSCVADHYYTTEQIKALPLEYKVEQVQNGNRLGPDYKVRELTPEEKERRAMQDKIKTLEKELEGKK